MGVVEGFGVPQLWALGLRMGLMLLCFSRVVELVHWFKCVLLSGFRVAQI